MSFGPCQQFAVLKKFPSELGRAVNHVLTEMVPERCGRAVIE